MDSIEITEDLERDRPGTSCALPSTCWLLQCTICTPGICFGLEGGREKKGCCHKTTPPKSAKRTPTLRASAHSRAVVTFVLGARASYTSRVSTTGGPCGEGGTQQMQSHHPGMTITHTGGWHKIPFLVAKHKTNRCISGPRWLLACWWWRASERASRWTCIAVRRRAS